MLTLYYVCFGVGVGYAVLTFILGEMLGALDLDADISGDISPLKPVVIAVFLTVFGAAGILLSRSNGVFVVVPLAGVMGMACAYLFHRFIIVPLYRAQNTSAIEQASLVGHEATVTEGIPQGGYGKITYYACGNTYSSPAKSETGNAIARNTTAEIVYIEKNTYYVREKIAKPLQGNVGGEPGGRRENAS